MVHYRTLLLNLLSKYSLRIESQKGNSSDMGLRKTEKLSIYMHLQQRVGV